MDECEISNYIELLKLSGFTEENLKSMQNEISQDLMYKSVLNRLEKYKVQCNNMNNTKCSTKSNLNTNVFYPINFEENITGSKELLSNILDEVNNSFSILAVIEKINLNIELATGNLFVYDHKDSFELNYVTEKENIKDTYYSSMKICSDICTDFNIISDSYIIQVDYLSSDCPIFKFMTYFLLIKDDVSMQIKNSKWFYAKDFDSIFKILSSAKLSFGFDNSTGFLDNHLYLLDYHDIIKTINVQKGRDNTTSFRIDDDDLYKNSLLGVAGFKLSKELMNTTIRLKKRNYSVSKSYDSEINLRDRKGILKDNEVLGINSKVINGYTIISYGYFKNPTESRTMNLNYLSQNDKFISHSKGYGSNQLDEWSYINKQFSSYDMISYDDDKSSKFNETKGWFELDWKVTKWEFDGIVTFDDSLQKIGVSTMLGFSHYNLGNGDYIKADTRIVGFLSQFNNLRLRFATSLELSLNYIIEANDVQNISSDGLCSIKVEASGKTATVKLKPILLERSINGIKKKYILFEGIDKTTAGGSAFSMPITGNTFNGVFSKATNYNYGIRIPDGEMDYYDEGTLVHFSGYIPNYGKAKSPRFFSSDYTSLFALNVADPKSLFGKNPTISDQFIIPESFEGDLQIGADGPEFHEPFLASSNNASFYKLYDVRPGGGNVITRQPFGFPAHRVIEYEGTSSHQYRINWNGKIDFFKLNHDYANCRLVSIECNPSIDVLSLPDITWSNAIFDSNDYLILALEEINNLRKAVYDLKFRIEFLENAVKELIQITLTNVNKSEPMSWFTVILEISSIVASFLLPCGAISIMFGIAFDIIKNYSNNDVISNASSLILANFLSIQNGDQSNLILLDNLTLKDVLFKKNQNMDANVMKLFKKSMGVRLIVDKNSYELISPANISDISYIYSIYSQFISIDQNGGGTFVLTSYATLDNVDLYKFEFGVYINKSITITSKSIYLRNESDWHLIQNPSQSLKIILSSIGFNFLFCNSSKAKVLLGEKILADKLSLVYTGMEYEKTICQDINRIILQMRDGSKRMSGLIIKNLHK